MRIARLSFVCVLALTWMTLSPTVQGQTFELLSANYPDGATNVPLAPREPFPPASQDSAFQAHLDSISIFFKFNKELPFNTNHLPKAHWEPRYKTFMWYWRHGEPLPNGGARRLNEPRYTIEHDPDTDYVVYVYGARAKGSPATTDGEAMARPFVLNYTTASEHGSNQVCGTAAFSADTPALDTPVARLVHGYAADALLPPVVPPDEAPRLDMIHPETGTAMQVDAPTVPSLLRAEGSSAQAHLAMGALQGPAEEHDITRSIILLLDAFDLNVGSMPARAGATTDENGQFCFNFVRPGTYYPIAINFADEDGEALGSYGYYDADGDRDPDTITITEGNDLSGLDVTLFTPAPFAASTHVETVQRFVAGFAPDARLVEISNTPHPILAVQATTPTDVSEAQPGQAYIWQYVFVEPSSPGNNARLHYVAMDPINVRTLTFTASPYHETQLAIPEGFIDSEAAVAIADENGGADFTASYPDTIDVPMTLTLGDLDLDLRPASPSVFWKVDYTVKETAQFDADTLTVFIDATTGAVLDPVRVSSVPPGDVPETFTLGQNYPNPFNPETTIPFHLTAQSHVRLTVYNVLGQEVAVLVDRMMSPGAKEVRWRGDNLASGVYLYRLETSEGVRTRTMMLSK